MIIALSVYFILYLPNWGTLRLSTALWWGLKKKSPLFNLEIIARLKANKNELIPKNITLTDRYVIKKCAKFLP